MTEERNYHIFYRMLKGLTAQEKASFHLTVASDYHYLSQGNCLTCLGMDDAQEFTNIRRAMKVIEQCCIQLTRLHRKSLKESSSAITDFTAWIFVRLVSQVLMFSEKETRILFTLLAAILHLGNLRFQGEVQIIRLSHTTCHTTKLKLSQSVKSLISCMNFIIITHCRHHRPPRHYHQNVTCMEFAFCLQSSDSRQYGGLRHYQWWLHCFCSTSFAGLSKCLSTKYE